MLRRIVSKKIPGLEILSPYIQRRIRRFCRQHVDISTIQYDISTFNDNYDISDISDILRHFRQFRHYDRSTKRQSTTRKWDNTPVIFTLL